ncbi:ribbon-helix-helix domain-containing protein [Tomitella fengzijianii]|uniref:Ribbon-helix-helix protein, CopG family n=1 Tax=Tomitella fengzijianii TaxID=2597660 RepID=A0A516WZ49_9ACTN|nr:ribbon-helix-helix domain-containing protein [Tomitella fengzijianii]QDQ96075.1 ribbon-helix-helix protein, CopG family [Tomitella fengzijianii]
MKISVSLPEEDLEILDSYMRESGLGSRSAAIQRAVRMLRNVDLEDDYAAAWSEWESSGDAAAWESVAGDGLADAAR